MADRIKGITIQIGGDTSGLNKALSGTNKEIKNTQSQLKDVERLLKLDPTNTELLAQKQRLLAEAVEETSGKLDVLKTAEKQVQDQFERGDISRQKYDSLKREIIETEHQLGKLESDAQAANKAVAKIDESPVEDVQSAAKKAGDALDDAGKKASNFADYLKAGAIVEGAKGIISSFKDLTEESKEHNKIMGSLEVSSQKAGYTSAQTEEAYKKLYGVLGDDQTTATTLANLQAIGLSQSDLMSVIDQFPTSIENGGTGATTAEAARENLGITLPLSVENGGTGETSLPDAITAMMEAVTPVSVTNFAAGVSPASTGGGLGSAKVQVRKIGKIVFLEGSVAIENFAGEYLTLCTLPSGYAPAGTIVFYATLTGSRMARFQIASSGVITLNWVYNAAGTEYTGAITWLQLNSMWLV